MIESYLVGFQLRFRGDNVSRQERHRQLLGILAQDPLLTDQSLARRLGVSVPTIRLDRMALGIPALQSRSRALAKQMLRVEAWTEPADMLGDVVSFVSGRSARASLVIDRNTPSMMRQGVVPAYFLLAQAERLLYRVLGADNVLPGLVYARYLRPVGAGERLHMMVDMVRKTRGRVVVVVQIDAGESSVFRAKYAVYRPASKTDRV